jgi:hypothetical protein
LNKNDNKDIYSTWTDTALKFTKPRFIQQQQEGKQQRRPRLLMGKIKDEFYKAIVVDARNNESKQVSKNVSSPTKSWKASTIRTTHSSAVPNRSLVEKKGLRSGQGATSFIKERTSSRPGSSQPRSYKRGELVYVFTLHYCAAMGLMQVGVLSKPPVWVYHKMMPSASPPNKRAAPSTSTAAAAANNDDDVDDTVSSPISSTATVTTVDSSTATTTPAQTIVRTHELIDLADDTDDDNDDEDDDDPSNRNEKSAPMVEMNV